MTTPAPITVLGSANLDYVVNVDHHPATGETVMGGDHSQIPGGKGANQAVAAALLGAPVTFLGMVGDDAAGQVLRESLNNAGVDTEALGCAPDTPTGIAMITVDAQGDNAITVSPGANMLVGRSMVDENLTALSASVLQLQLEVPIDTVTHAAKAATGLVILDPAPAPSNGLPRELLDAVDVLVPNETELALLADRAVDPMDVDDIAEAARSLNVDTIVVSLGENGAVVVTSDEVVAVPTPKITPVDTTAAGDAFRSALSVRLASGSPIVEAVEFAVRVGAATAMAAGAQPSLPTPAEVDERLS